MDNKLPVPIGGHVLPPLPYTYAALEPIIDARTLQIHHDKHHKAYVDGLNRAEKAASAMRKSGDYEFASYWQYELAFNGSGHILHSIYWTIMAPQGRGGAPRYETINMINAYFGSFEGFKDQFTKAAQTVSGSGWAVLCYNPAFGHLEILQAEKHQNLTQWGVIPILVCDVWEHAYYLKYQNNRAEYIDKWWEIINWNETERRLLLSYEGIMPLTAADEYKLISV